MNWGDRGSQEYTYRNKSREGEILGPFYDVKSWKRFYIDSEGTDF